MRKELLFAVMFVMLIPGCASKGLTPSDAASKPEWLWKPSADGRVGGVGIAKEHINGADAQRMLAVSRAIDAIAVQIGVKVNNVMLIESRSDSGGASSVMIESYSLHSAEGSVVRAAVREFWSDPYTKELYVWMVVEE